MSGNLIAVSSFRTSTDLKFAPTGAQIESSHETFVRAKLILHVADLSEPLTKADESFLAGLGGEESDHRL